MGDDKPTIDATPTRTSSGVRVRIDIPEHEVADLVRRAVEAGGFQRAIRREIREQVRDMVRTAVADALSEVGLETEAQRRSAVTTALGQWLHAREGWVAKQIRKAGKDR